MSTVHDGWNLHFVGGLQLPLRKFNIADGRHIENRYDVIPAPRRDRFGRNLVSTDRCRMTCGIIMQRWKSKPEVEFQHHGRLFSETGISNISAVDMSPKFGLHVDFRPFQLLEVMKNETGNRFLKTKNIMSTFGRVQTGDAQSKISSRYLKIAVEIDHFYFLSVWW